MAKITGLGGIFVKRADPDATSAWYKDVLGVSGEYGPVFRWADEPQDDPFSLLSSFPADTSYLDPGTRGFMINFRVDDLDAFQAALEAKGVEILARADEPYGKFAWILDPDGIKLELWEQIGPAPAG